MTQETLATLTEETEPLMSSTEKSIRQLRKDVKSLQMRMNATSREAEYAKKRVKILNDLLNGDLVAAANEDSKEVHRVYRVVNLKTNVATETVFIARAGEKDADKAHKLALASILAFDLPNSWWMEREEICLADWMGILLDIYEHGLPEIEPEQLDPEQPEDEEMDLVAGRGDE